MKYPYSIEYINPDWPIMRLPKEIDVVTPFLLCEVEDPMGRDSRLEEIDLVLQGEESILEIGGNACGLVIQKDITRVIYFWPPVEDDPNSECLIETEELKKLLLVWLDLRRRIYYAGCLHQEKNTVNAALALIK